MSVRKIKRVVTGIRGQDGAGVKLTRVISRPDVEDFDPFLMLDAFDSRNPDDYIRGFPFHPHRGIETVTYLIHGDIEHKDSLGNHGSITDSSCQWMTAGGGIIHQEMPQATPWLLGTQLWINLPKKDKMVHPKYNDIQPKDMAKVSEKDAQIVVIAGEYNGTASRMQGDHVKATYLDVILNPNAVWEYDSIPENTLFVYLVHGSAYFDEEEQDILEYKRAVLFGEGDKLHVKAGPEGVRFLLLTGKPLKEPVAWGGPIVMNTQEELEQAFDEIENGTFAKDCEKAHLDYYSE